MAIEDDIEMVENLSHHQHEVLADLRKDLPSMAGEPLGQYEKQALRNVGRNEMKRYEAYKAARKAAPGYDTEMGELTPEAWRRLSKYLQDSATAQFLELKKAAEMPEEWGSW